jgi:3-oxoadipate enol-lactonase
MFHTREEDRDDTRYVTVDDGCQIRYRLDGPPDGPVLLLSNSLGTSLDMWSPQIQAFAESFHVLRYDSRGHGASDAPPGPYTMERLGRDALALLDALGVSRASVCGVSLGGMVGMWLGAHAPERIARLVLSNTAAIQGSPQLWNDRIGAVRAGGMAAIVDATLERWFTPAFRLAQPDTIASIRAMVLATPPEGYANCCAAIRDMDQRSSLPGISAPTLVVVGARDSGTTPAQGEAIAAAIPGAQLHTLDAAHLSNIEQAQPFNARVLRFLT